MGQIADALVLELRHAEDPEGLVSSPSGAPTAAATMAAISKMREHHPAHARGLLPGTTHASGNNANDDEDEDDIDESSSKVCIYLPPRQKNLL